MQDNKKDNWYDKALRFISDTKFFVLTLVAFVVNAGWIALSSNLLPYDEYYHIGIIKFYSHQWLPFVSSQPQEMSLYGDVTRLPSYIFHYLMSFPYRLIDTVIHNETAIIVCLRLINISMVVVGIIIFRRLLLKTGFTKKIINLGTLVFVFTPIVPVLSAQNNYDNMMFMLTPVFLSCAYNFLKDPKRPGSLINMLSVGMLATLVKFNFIVMFGATVLFIFTQIYKQGLPGWFNGLKQNISKQRKKLILPLIFFVLITGLFIERTGYNALKYGQIKVDCAKVQSVEVCDQYSPWHRNKIALATKPGVQLYGGPIGFSELWISRMTKGFYAIYANIIPQDLNRPDPYGVYVFKPILPIPFGLGCLALLTFIILTIIYYKSYLKNKLLHRLFLFVALVTTLSLWIFNLLFYYKYGQAYAIQARYLLAILMPILVIFLDLLRLMVIKLPNIIKPILIVMVFMYCFSGGVSGWVVRADTDWYWPNQTVMSVNKKAQIVLKKVIPN